MKDKDSVERSIRWKLGKIFSLQHRERLAHEYEQELKRERKIRLSRKAGKVGRKLHKRKDELLEQIEKDITDYVQVQEEEMS